MSKLKLFLAPAVCLILSLILVTCGGGSYAMVSVPGGSFQMGSDDGPKNEQPAHTVTLSAFYMGRTEVTQALYQSVMGHNPSYFKGDANRPVEQVTWYDAVEFCNKLSKREGLQQVYTISGRTPAKGNPITDAAVTADWSKNGYRLPTEAEWEYAARGGNGSPGNYTYAGSDDADDVAWYSDNSDETHHIAGTKDPNGLGLYDMSGNVWEWCWDWNGSYSSEAQTDPTGMPSGAFRILRGGSWFNPARGIRPEYRDNDIPEVQSGTLGFRLARR